MAQVNMYLPLVQREKLLIHTYKRLLKILLLYPKLHGHSNLHLLYLNHQTFIGQIHHLCLELQLAVYHYHLGVIMLHHRSVFLDDMVVVIQQANPFSYCYSSSNESTPRGWPSSKESDQGKSIIVMPDFAQVYRFIGSVFDPNATNHLQTLKQMNPINVKTVLLSMRNLSTNLRSPEFENERRLLSLYNANLEKGKSGSHHRNQPLSDRSESAVLYA
ncbi:hypothetical protein AAZX31_09G234000 [Glycine max]|nr:hypothetical protein GYH30_026169 [Glycine max]KAH1044782.1 hypothetical protein GYH30_026169 [Glycine max]KAH1044784.1 hypothetical protein GYH30_026169 [Glycine max]